MLAPGAIEVDRPEEAVGGVVEGPPERRARTLNEDVAQVAVMLWAPYRRSVRSSPQDSRGRPPCTRGTLAGYAASERIERVAPAS